jgi:flagellar M-ring protein FliF
MNAFFEQFLNIFKAMPASKKVALISVVALVVTGFVLMFIWANQVDFQPLYTNLPPEDASDIISKLKEERVPYKLEGDGSIVLVPAEQIYELRLNLAGKGLPRGGSVGFEIFDHTDFNTTEFVQRLNYQRALQGELVRTINQFKEVISSRVLIVFPRESLFVEDTQPPSASILLNLRSSLSPEKVTSIVHLVACAVEGLTIEHITVVDTTGKTLFKGGGADENGFLAGAKLDYQQKVEKTIGDRIQSMLDAVVGGGKAIVRVSADIDFNKIETSEEIYDPDSAVVRSKQHQVESSERNNADTRQAVDKTKKENINEILNYEINRLNRHTIRPFGTLTRLSVAVVLDGTYRTIKGEDGVEKKQYIPRTPEELKTFETIVSKAIGYDPDRGDQITVSSFPFAQSAEMEDMIESLPIDWLAYARQYARTAINLLLAFVVFIFVVRPLLKSMKSMKITEYVKQRELPGSPAEGKMEELEFLTESPEIKLREGVAKLAKSNTERSQQLLKGWLNRE